MGFQTHEVTTSPTCLDETDSVANPEKQVTVQTSPLNVHDGSDSSNSEEEARILKTTGDDAQHMQRLGKKQVLVRNFRLFSMISFTALATAAWEFNLFAITPTLQNGGLPELLIPNFYNFVLFIPIFLSVAEMVSMAPTSGTHYHWVSEFAPDDYQQIMSYIVGWVSTLAWQAGNAASGILVGNVVQVIIGLVLPDYAAPAWHATLLTIGAIVIAYIGNVHGNKALPYWQNGVFTVHLAAYFAVIIPIWVNVPRATHGQVWLEFTNSAGWSNMGLTFLVGQAGSFGNFVGLDTAAHMSEEVRHASRSLPLAMMIIYFINFVITITLSLTLAYHLPDLTAALEDISGYPVIHILQQAMSNGWLIALLAVTMTITVASNVVFLAAVSRDLFAFARDQGLPFSSWISSVDKKQHVPVNACILSCVLSLSMSLIYIGSSTAFYAISGLYSVSLIGCYIISISCCLWRRTKHPETMPRGHFSLGRWGPPVNTFSVLYATWAFFWSFWPYGTPVTPDNMNWASPIFAVAIITAILYFFFGGRKNYKGPVVQVQDRGADR